MNMGEGFAFFYWHRHKWPDADCDGVNVSCRHDWRHKAWKWWTL